jgi:hypothetical protein
MARTSYISIRSGFSSAISLKQQSTGRHVAPLWHIILWFQPIFVITPKCYALSGEAENTNFIIFDLSGLWLVLYHTHGRYTTHYTINVVQGSILSNKFCFWQPNLNLVASVTTSVIEVGDQKFWIIESRRWQFFCFGLNPRPIYMATNLSYSNDMLTVELSGFPDMYWRDLFTSTTR